MLDNTNGLYGLLFDNKKWRSLYYDNCTLKTSAEWSATGTTNIPVDVGYLTFALVSECLYIPFMIAMKKPEFFQHTCYKFMFVLGIVDMITLPCNGIIGGIQGLLGLHYCSNPYFFYCVGLTMLYGWYATTLVCCLIAIDRFFEIIFPKTAKKLFKGKRIYIWLTIPVWYMLIFFDTKAILFNINKHAVHADPFYATELQGYDEFYQLNFLVFNSAWIVIVMGICYVSLCIYLTLKTYYFKSIQSMTRLQRAMVLQSIAICIEVFFSATVYVSNQWIKYPDFVNKLEHITWICVHGDTPIVYLLLNASLRRKFFGMIKEYTKKTGKTAIKLATSVYPTKIRMRIQNQDMWTTSTQPLDLRTSRQSQAPVSQYRQARLPPLRNAQMAQIHFQ